METMTLMTETGQLLDLVVNSLYTQREIFLRELISNASDALDRFHFEALSQPELLEDANRLEISLEVDLEARTLTVRDNGIGMSREEVVNHIGTIARSGTKEFEAHVNGPQDGNRALNLIGRFGVGFYSCFMVADKVTLLTRRAGDQNGTRWESTGSIHYTLTECSNLPRGTSVTLHLKPVDVCGGIEDYTDRWVLSRVVKRYVDLLTYPILYVGPSSEADRATAADARGTVIVLNSMNPIWTRSDSEVTPDEHDEFYRHISQDWSEPLITMAFKAEGRWEYTALLFIPSHAPYDLYYHGAAYGLQVYSRRMLIVENCQDLVPKYLRFMKGVVDVADLPLNVSRQSLQDANQLTTIRKWLARKVIDTINKIRETATDKYVALWREFGRALKEGISEDYENRDRLTRLVLFESSVDPSKLTTLAEYVARMKPDQKDIFYLSGESRSVIECSPHLEEFLSRGYEVLFLTEPVDELVTNSLTAFDSRRLRSIAKGKVDLGNDAERERAAGEVEEQTQRLGGLLQFLAKRLDTNVRAVQISRRLTVSPACLVGDEFDHSPHIDRLLRKGKGGEARQRRILEVNPRHPVVLKMQKRLDDNCDDPMLSVNADVLFGFAVLAEGSDLPDPVGFNRRLTELMSCALAVDDV